jgi:hypothetical protein
VLAAALAPVHQQYLDEARQMQAPLCALARARSVEKTVPSWS